MVKSEDVRALVSQEHEASIYMRFRSPVGNIVTPILLDESLTTLLVPIRAHWIIRTSMTPRPVEMDIGL
jgi:hypothetical protein